MLTSNFWKLSVKVIKSSPSESSAGGIDTSESGAICEGDIGLAGGEECEELEADGGLVEEGGLLFGAALRVSPTSCK